MEAEAAAVGGREPEQSISCLSRFLPLGLTGRRREREREGDRHSRGRRVGPFIICHKSRIIIGLDEFPQQHIHSSCTGMSKNSKDRLHDPTL